MTVWDRVFELIMTGVLIVGGYQFYFWAQRRTWFRARDLSTRWDRRITYDPRWVWVYCVLYYPMILLVSLVQPSWAEYAYVVQCFLMLLAVQVSIFVLWPTAIPSWWRTEARWKWEHHKGPTWAQRLLDLVWSFDNLRNGCPSMHVSMAMLVDLMIWRQSPKLGLICCPFPVLIAISALKTKQHFIADVLPGAALGWGMFLLWSAIRSM